MLTKVLKGIERDAPWIGSIHDDLARLIISGLYREMRSEESPKPVLLLAACRVIGDLLTEKKTNLTINAASIYGQTGFYIDIDEPTKIEGTLPDVLIEFADGLPE